MTLIEELILKTYPGTKVEYLENQLIVKFSDTHTVNLGPDSNWITIKKRIDKILENKKNGNMDECEICNNDMSIVISCVKCCNLLCLKCMIEIMMRNKGSYNCPYCRNQLGKQIDDPYELREFLLGYVKYIQSMTDMLK